MGFFPIHRLVSLGFKSICFLFLAICFSSLTCNRIVVLDILLFLFEDLIVWLVFTAEQWPFQKVNFMCDDLNSLALIFHFFSHLFLDEVKLS
jgi:hypothetical protein